MHKFISVKVAVALVVLLGVVLSVAFFNAERLGGSYFGPKERFSVRDSVFDDDVNAEPDSEVIPTQGSWSLVKRNDELNLLTRLIAAEASGEPYEGQVAVAAVMLNRVRNASFPNTISGVIYQPRAFESVSNGLIWRVANLDSARRAATDALNGWDPTYGALYFWNPYKPVSSWIWSRKIVRQIGQHVFGI